MANVRELRGRIKSVSNIAKITKAMEMVASMKLRRVQARAVALHPYTAEIRALVEHLAEHVGRDTHRALFRAREVKTVGVFLVTSDRGLCGAYNSNMMLRLLEFLRQVEQKRPGAKVKFFCYGRKGYSYLNRRSYDIERYFVDPPLDKLDFASARVAADALVEAFTDGVVDEMHLAYTRFVSMARFEPTFEPLLPVTHIRLWGDDNIPSTQPSTYLLEPNADVLFEHLVPKYLETMVFDAMLQSLTSEHASRRMAMKGATDAAGRMSKDLRKVYNRARQEKITKELMDIVGGTAAVS
ncbi:MAG: ATP synthase F1 subunit gamma [Planctomycetota bacterium]